MPIITISRQTGSLGDELAKAAADQLGYAVIEKEKINKFFHDKGLSSLDVDKLDEKKPSIWQSISTQKKKFSHLIRAAVYELAAKENVVILGRGGQAILQGIVGVIHVRIVAPYATKIDRIMQQEGCDEKEAEHIIRHRDHDSSGYIRAYFDTDWDDPDLYDMVINTRTISIETGVSVITSAAHADEFKGGSQVHEKFLDLALAQEVKAAILDIPWMEISDLRAEKGVIHISGLAKSEAAKKECEEAIMAVTGVEKIVNDVRVSERKRPWIV